MRKSVIKFLALSLAFILSVGIAGCKKGGSSPDKDKPEPADKKTGYNLVDDRESGYTIVMPDKPKRNESFARDELITFFRYSTGIKLPVISASEAALNYGKNSRYIVLGDALPDVSPVKENLPIENYAIKVKDGNVFIKGGDDTGVLYGVYAFLHDEIGYEAYAKDCVAYKKDVRSLPLYDIDEKDGPDFVYRNPNYGIVWYDPTAARRLRYSENIWILERGNFIHNSFDEYFPVDVYKEAHREYYSKDGNQLCYTGRGNEATVREMQDIVVARIKELVNKNYSQGKFIHNISFTQQDDRRWCKCDACLALKEKYGDAYAAASLIRFVNPVAREIKAWMEETWPGQELNIVIFAYHATIYAPVTEKDGKYAPIDDSVKLEDNVGVLYAPIDMNFHYDFEAKQNAEWKEVFEKWSSLSNNLYLWSYSACVTDYFIWYDTFNSMQSIYRKAKSLNTRYIFDQSRYNAMVLTAFDGLKLYLNSKLQWNVDADYTKLIDDYFKNYFGPAGKSMKEFFDAYRAHMAYLRATTAIAGDIFTLPKKEHYSKEVLRGWYQYIEKAYDAIEPLKESDPKEYKTLYDRINMESLAIRFHLIHFHSETYSAEELRKLKGDFIRDAKHYGFSLYAEYQFLDSIIEKW